MPRFYVKMHLKSTPQKPKFLMAKAMSKSCRLDLAANALAQSRMVTHSNTALFLIKTILCENTNNRFSKNYWKLGKMNVGF